MTLLERAAQARAQEASSLARSESSRLIKRLETMSFLREDDPVPEIRVHSQLGTHVQLDGLLLKLPQDGSFGLLVYAYHLTFREWHWTPVRRLADLAGLHFADPVAQEKSA